MLETEFTKESIKAEHEESRKDLKLACKIAGVFVLCMMLALCLSDCATLRCQSLQTQVSEFVNMEIKR